MTQWEDIKVGGLYTPDGSEVWFVAHIDGPSEWGKSIGKELMTLTVCGPRGVEHQTVECGCSDWLVEVGDV